MKWTNSSKNTAECKLTQGEIRHLSFREIEFVIKSLHTRERQAPMISPTNSIKYQSQSHVACFLYEEEKLINVLFIIEGEQKCCKSFREARITLLPKLDKDSSGKAIQTSVSPERGCNNASRNLSQWNLAINKKANTS